MLTFLVLDNPFVADKLHRWNLLGNPYFSDFFPGCFPFFFARFFPLLLLLLAFCFCFCFFFLLLAFAFAFAFAFCFCFVLFLLLLLLLCCFAFASAFASADYLLCIDTATKLDDKTFTLSFDTQLHQSRNEAAQRCLYLISLRGGTAPSPAPPPAFF